MLELLIELLANRLGLFILGVILAIGGVYGWMDFRHDVRLYDAATGADGKTAQAKIVWKNTEQNRSDSYRSDGGATLVGYINVEFETENGNQTVKVYLDSDEYDSVKEGDTIKIKYNPENPEYVVTPKMKRGSVLFASIVTGFCTILGILLCIAVIISFL